MFIINGILWFFFAIRWIIFGGIVGSIACYLHPGDEKLGCVSTIVLGIIGSYLGAIVSYMLGFHGFPITLLSSVAGSVLACYIWSRYNG